MPAGDRSGSPRSGRGALIQALGVRRHAAIGLFFGVVVASGVFAFFVLVPDADRDPLLYVALAVVLALSLGLLFTGALVLWAAIRLLRDPDRIPQSGETER